MATLRSRPSASQVAAKGEPSWLRFYALDQGKLVYVPAGFSSEQGTIIPVGTKLILDFRHFREGEVSLDPFDDSRMVQFGHKLPPKSGDEGYSDGLQVDTIVQRYGFATLTSIADGVCKLLYNLHDTYCFAEEAREDKLPVYRLETPRSFQNSHKNIQFGLRLTLIGWPPRSQYLRQPLLPIPAPVTGSAIECAQQTVKEDAAFASTAPQGEAVAQEIRKGTKSRRMIPAASHASVTQFEKSTQVDPDLNDDIPF